MRSGGVVHALWSIGDHLVLRIPKNETMCIGDALCEIAAIPRARAAGVRTPGLAAFDTARDIVDVPYSIVERVHGVNLSALKNDDTRLADLYRDLGRQLALVHRASREPNPSFRTPDTETIDVVLDEALRAGMLHPAGIDWFRALLDRLDRRLEGESAEACFLHNDVKPDNAMLDMAGRLHLIDWGDASIGDAANDFHSLPLTAVVHALDGYRAAGARDDGIEARILRRIAIRSLTALRRAPLTGPSWYRPLAATLTDLLTFAIADPARWGRWTG